MANRIAAIRLRTTEAPELLILGRVKPAYRNLSAYISQRQERRLNPESRLARCHPILVKKLDNRLRAYLYAPQNSLRKKTAARNSAMAPIP